MGGEALRLQVAPQVGVGVLGRGQGGQGRHRKGKTTLSRSEKRLAMGQGMERAEKPEATWTRSYRKSWTERNVAGLTAVFQSCHRDENACQTSLDAPGRASRQEKALRSSYLLLGISFWRLRLRCAVWKRYAYLCDTL